MPKSQSDASRIRIAAPILRAPSARVTQFAVDSSHDGKSLSGFMRRHLPLFYGRQAEWHQADILVAGANPLLAVIIVGLALRKGQSVLWWSNHHADDWPWFLCQDPAFRHITAQSIGWSGPDPGVWGALDDLDGRFGGDVDADACRRALLWCRSLAEWALYPSAIPEKKASFGLLKGTGLLSLASSSSAGAAGDEIMLYARIAAHMKPPALDPRDVPVHEINRICDEYAAHHFWHRRGRWARLVFARHVFALSRLAVPARCVAGVPVSEQIVSGMMLGSARTDWNDSSPVQRIQAVLEDIMTIRIFFTE